VLPGFTIPVAGVNPVQDGPVKDGDMVSSTADAPNSQPDLLDAVLAIGAGLDLQTVLHRIVEAAVRACALTTPSRRDAGRERVVSGVME